MILGEKISGEQKEISEIGKKVFCLTNTNKSAEGNEKNMSWSMKFGLYNKKSINESEKSSINNTDDNMGNLNISDSKLDILSSETINSGTNLSRNINYSFWPNSFEEIQRGGSAVFSRLASRIEEGIQDLQLHLRPDFPKLPEELRNKEIPIGFSFSVSAMLIPYHLGVILELQEQGYITESTPLSGASGGSIAAVCCALEISVYEAMNACLSLYEDCRKNGTTGRLNEVLERELRKKLPDNVVELLKRRAEKGGQTIISYTQLLPVPKANFVSEFTSKDDLIECILASSTIPFLSVPWATFKCRGKPCVDGYFAVGRGELGCLPTNARRTVKVCPLASAGSSMKSSRSDVISPHIQIYDWILFNTDNNNIEFETRDWIRKLRPKNDVLNSTDLCRGSKDNKMVDNTDAEVLFNREKESIEDEDLKEGFNNSFFNNNPNLAAPPIMKYSNNELLRIAVDPPSTRVAWELFYIGRGDALRWVMIDRIRTNSYKLMEPMEK